VLHDASAGAARRRLGSSAADQGPEGGPRSPPERSPRALRERVRPEVRLETPPRIPAGRATLRAAQQFDGSPPFEDDLVANPPAIVNIYPLNLPEVMITNSAQRFDEHGNLVEDATRDVMRKFLQALALLTRQVEHGKPIQA
jgi:hypothetical protein